MYGRLWVCKCVRDNYWNGMDVWAWAWSCFAGSTNWHFRISRVTDIELLKRPTNTRRMWFANKCVCVCVCLHEFVWQVNFDTLALNECTVNYGCLHAHLKCLELMHFTASDDDGEHLEIPHHNSFVRFAALHFQLASQRFVFFCLAMLTTWRK